MRNTIEDITRKDRQVLSEELERRYGAGAAQEIMDQLERVRVSGHVPDCLLVKTLCDLNELFRSEAKALAAHVRQCRTRWSCHGNKITPIEQPVLEAEFRKITRLWWVTMKMFYPCYKRALTEAQKPKFPGRFTDTKSPNGSPEQPPGTPLCRARAA